MISLVTIIYHIKTFGLYHLKKSTPPPESFRVSLPIQYIILFHRIGEITLLLLSYLVALHPSKYVNVILLFIFVFLFFFITYGSRREILASMTRLRDLNRRRLKNFILILRSLKSSLLSNHIR